MLCGICYFLAIDSLVSGVLALFHVCNAFIYFG